MFLEKETIRHADSPRLLSLRPWLFSNSVRTTNHYTKTTPKTDIHIDVRNHDESIQHGFTYVDYNDRTKRLEFVFKHANGIYKQHGFAYGSINIPLPDLYIEGKVELYGSRHRSQVSYIAIGSEFLQQIPLSNIYYENATPAYAPRYINNNTRIYYSKICVGDSFLNLAGASPTALEAINKIANIITPFLLTNGNLDIEPLDYCYDRHQPTAKTLIERIGADTSDYAESYSYYWSLLNLLSDTAYTPTEIYQRLANCDTRRAFNELLSENNITLSDIKTNTYAIDNEIDDDDDEDDDW